MSFGVVRNSRLALARGAALVLIGGLTAGCSSGVARFTDGLTTASTTPNQQQIINSQPAPVQSAPAAEETYSISDARSAAPARASSQSVQRGELAPVSGSAVRTAATTAPIEQAPARAAKADPIDPLSRSVERAGVVESAAKVARKDPAGWSSAGGSQITAKEGETVFNLSRRYGVPADVLMKVNGIGESGALHAGQKVLIPTYVYSDRAPVSAPDNNPKVAASKSSRGLKEPEQPKPLEEPKQVAVLPSQPKPKSGAGSYMVESGDTLIRIAKKHGVSVDALKKANGIEDANVRLGQTLKIPGAGETVVAAKPAPVDPQPTASTAPAKKTQLATESEPKLAAYTPPKTKAVEEAAQEDDSEAPDGTGIGKMRWPVKGRVISAYGKGSGTSKDGIDIQVPQGTPVKAAENGVVIYAGDGLKDFGNTVLVRHENGLVTVYGNASELKVKRGQKVKRGEDLALSGVSSATNTPKLHFEVRKDAAAVDPSGYLQ